MVVLAVVAVVVVVVVRFQHPSIPCGPRPPGGPPTNDGLVMDAPIDYGNRRRAD